MRWLFAVMFVFISCIPISVFAADIQASSSITAVTVFADRATVTREMKIDVPVGDSTIVISDLPLRLDVSSLRVKGKGLSPVVIGALDHKHISSNDFVVPREKEISEKLEGLLDEQALVEADQVALMQKKQFLETLSRQAALRQSEDIAVMNLKPEQWAQSAAMVEKETREALRGLAQTKVKLREINKQVDHLNNELSGLRTGAKSTIQVSIPVEAKVSGTVTLSLSYQLPQAGWEPVYDARLDTKTGQIQLQEYGRVYQQTGEEWRDVKLTLSTAQPARGAVLPWLHPMWVRLVSKQSRDQLGAGLAEMGDARSNISSTMMVQVKKQGVPMSSLEESDWGGAKQEAFLEERSATVSSTEYAAEYEIAGAHTVRPDGSQRKVLIGTREIEGELVAKVKPQLDSRSAYLVAMATIKGEAPLLAGQASLFRDGGFIGTTQLPFLRTGEKAELGFGVDDKIIVKSRLINDKQGEEGVIAKDQTRQWQNVTEIQNLHKKPISVTLLHTVPVPQDKDISFRLDKAYTTEGFEEDVNKIKGQMRWSKDLKAEEKWNVSLGWFLSWPANRQLSGLSF